MRSQSLKEISFLKVDSLKYYLGILQKASQSLKEISFLKACRNVSCRPGRRPASQSLKEISFLKESALIQFLTEELEQDSQSLKEISFLKAMEIQARTSRSTVCLAHNLLKRFLF